MSILATMFVSRFNSGRSVFLIESFFHALQYCKVAKEKKQFCFKLNDSQKFFSVARAEQQRSTVLKCCNFAQSWTALFRAFSSHRQPSASLIKVIPQLDKTLGRTGQTFRASTVAEGF